MYICTCMYVCMCMRITVPLAQMFTLRVQHAVCLLRLATFSFSFVKCKFIYEITLTRTYYAHTQTHTHMHILINCLYSCSWFMSLFERRSVAFVKAWERLQNTHTHTCTHVHVCIYTYISVYLTRFSHYFVLWRIWVY